MPVKPNPVRDEQLVDRVLRDLPLRRAPAALESRVFRELERRAALPWWRQGFKHWPLAARAAFAAICSAIAGITIVGSWATAGIRVVNGAGDLAMSWTHPAVAVIAWAGQFSALLIRAIPPVWFYAVMAAGAILYAVLFGLGAAAYRTLYLQPSMADDRVSRGELR